MLAQTTETVSLEVLSFQRSADVLVILILGGAGRLYGGIIGAIIYMVARDQLSGLNPQYWYFWIGLLADRRRHVPAERHPRRACRGCGRSIRSMTCGSASLWGAAMTSPATTPALATRGLSKSFGSLAVTQNVEIALPQGARYALIGPNGAGKTTLINLMTGLLKPDAGIDPAQRRGHHAAAAAGARASAA